MAPTNPNQAKGYQFKSEEKQVTQEPQKMQQPKEVEAEVESPEEVKAEKVETPKNRSGITDNARRVQSAHPAFRQGAQVKDKKVEETQQQEEVAGSDDRPEKQENYSKRGASESFMGVEAPTPLAIKEPPTLPKKVDPVQKAKQAVDKLESTAGGGFEATSLPANVKFALKVARRWQQIPAQMTDDDALAGGFLTPEMLQLILTIAMSFFQDCLPNQPAVAWSRIKNFTSTKPMDRLSDEIRMSWIVDRWMQRMAFPRDKGDVRMISKAIAEEAAGSSEQEFRAVQNEMLFMTV